MKRRIAVVVVGVAMLVVAGCSGNSSGLGGDSKSFDFWSFFGINQKAAVEEY